MKKSTCFIAALCCSTAIFAQQQKPASVKMEEKTSVSAPTFVPRPAAEKQKKQETASVKMESLNKVPQAPLPVKTRKETTTEN